MDKLIEKEFSDLVKFSPKQAWYHKFEVVNGSGVYTPGKVNVAYYENRMKVLNLEKEFFRGKRVIDIGAFTGAFSFFLEDMGADVVAVDVFDPDANGFNIVHKVRKSKIKHIVASVYDLNPVDFGYFDVVAFFGVYYHLKHPLLAFERVNSLLRNGGLCIGGGTSSQRWFHNDHEDCQEGVDFDNVTKEKINDSKIMSVDSLNELALCGFSKKQFFKDKTNWFIPNKSCLEGWLEVSGFAVEKLFATASPIDRDWNINNTLRSSLAYKAYKKAEPTEEYSSPNMKPYTIPTSSELDRYKK
jgi:tRNA (mo5U34)-methyltransferase